MERLCNLCHISKPYLPDDLHNSAFRIRSRKCRECEKEIYTSTKKESRSVSNVNKWTEKIQELNYTKVMSGDLSQLEEVPLTSTNLKRISLKTYNDFTNAIADKDLIIDSLTDICENYKQLEEFHNQQTEYLTRNLEKQEKLIADNIEIQNKINLFNTELTFVKEQLTFIISKLK